ncbi:DNA methylase [Chitinimonas prasina]|uniref:DNA methylase n=1 Tax=Chitinimonas prasina TaxID=1434937 RepID=A0ABQ5YJ99_9NEIS|nr:metallophosphoesterase family protein [Chitinimonas prasina]GLR13752.1 DNA methylase [Chitinimonas prasina]
MRLALISDIHGNLPALQAVLADIARRGITQIANLGDSLSGPLWPEETAVLLRQQSWPQLAGNHERQLLTQHLSRMAASDRHARQQISPATLQWLASLPPTHRMGEVLLCHGTPTSDLAYCMETVTPTGCHMATPTELDARLGQETARLIACGHTHLPRTLCAPDGRRVVNPGSVGLPAYDDDNPHFHLVENGSPDARYAIVERLAHGWQVDLLALPYDFESAAAQAARNGRPDWAHALRTGYALVSLT